MEVEVVVPTLNAERTLRRCLQSLRSQSFPVCVIVVDGGSSDHTLSIASEMADRVVRTDVKGFSHQRNLGALGSGSDVLGFVDADMILEDDVVKEAVSLIAGGAAGVVVPEKSFGPTYWARVRAFERSFYEGSDSPEAARFIRRERFLQVGGYDERLSSMEDFALDRSVRALGPIGRTVAIIEHDEGELTFFNACRKKARYANGMADYARIYGHRQFASFLFGRNYVRLPLKLAARPSLGVGVIALKTGESVAVFMQLFGEVSGKFIRRLYRSSRT